MSKAIFTSRTGALTALVNVGIRKGIDRELICTRGRHYPVYRRGELVGFEAWLPHGTGGRPIYEEEVA